jgi:DNA-binding NarL/FixJ family response regulator
MKPYPSSRDVPSPPAPPRTLLIVDDHPVFRSGLAAIVRRVGELKICGQAGNAAQAMELFRAMRPDVVVTDIWLPDTDGISLSRQMCRERPETCILVVSQFDDPIFAAKAMLAGARGYLRKDEGLVELAVALRKVSRNRIYVSKRFQSNLLLDVMAKHHSDAASLLDTLSPRETQVFRCLGRGLSGQAIADELGMGIKTVETHRASIKKKLNLPTAADVRQLASNWISIEAAEIKPHDQNAVGFLTP